MNRVLPDPPRRRRLSRPFVRSFAGALACFSAAFVCSAVVTTASRADAYRIVQSYSPVGCTWTQAGTITTGTSSSAGPGQVANLDTAAAHQLFCPVMYESTSPLAESNTLVTAQGWANGNYGLSVRACRTFWQGGGGTCSVVGTAGTWSVADVAGLATAWVGGTYLDAYFLEMNLPPAGGGSSAVIFGYQILLVTPPGQP